MVIDIINIIMTVFIVLAFAACIIWQEEKEQIFPIIFASGGIVNLVTALKKFMTKNQLSGTFLIVISALLFVLAVFCRYTEVSLSL
jgi:tryptophan-rich sensory protein